MMHLDQLPNQKPDEKVVKFLRRQWFTWMFIIVAGVFMLAVPTLIALYFQDKLMVGLAHPILGPIIVILGSIYVLSVWLFSFLEFTDYYLDTWIITNDRIINTEQKGLFNRVASELHLASVQDVTSNVKGMIRTFFDYGDVLIQTAGEKERFIFKGIDHPEKIKETIIRVVQEYKTRHAADIVAAVAEGTKTV